MICFTFTAKCFFIYSKNPQYSSLNISVLCHESHLPLTLVQSTSLGSLQSHIKNDMRWRRGHFYHLRQPPSIKSNKTPSKTKTHTTFPRLATFVLQIPPSVFRGPYLLPITAN